MEIQTLKRRFSSVETIANQLYALSVTYAPDLAVTFNLERSNDPLEINDGKKEKFWPSLSVGFQPDQNNSLNLFYGKRRGGNACTGGICYRVLPFEGLELQLTTRF